MIKNDKYIGSEINGLKIVGYKSVNKKQYFDCICVCGKPFTTRTDALKAGYTKSCGCLTGDLISSKNRLPNNNGAINLVYRTYKHNADKRNLEFSLTTDEFSGFIFGNCVYCGAEPTLSKFSSSQKTRRDRFLVYNRIDRVDSNYGYIASNCVSCCSICNAAKSDLSVEDFKSWISRLIEFNRKNNAKEE